MTDAADAGGITLAFVLGQLAVAPLSFGLALRSTGLRLAALLRQLAPGLLAAAVAFALVALLRPLLEPGLAAAARLLLLGATYAGAVALLLAQSCGTRLRTEWADLAAAARPKERLA